MKKFITLLLIILGLNMQAQDFLPFATGPYAGISGVQLQPASIVDSRYKVDVALFSTSLDFSNNYLAIDQYPLFKNSAFKEDHFGDHYLFRKYNGKPKSAYISMQQDVMSFMVSITKKDAIAITPSIRGMVNIDGVTEDLMHFVEEGLDYPSLFNQQLSNANFSMQSHTWAQLALTYGRVVLDKNQHFLKAGVTVKLLQGIGSAHFFVKDFNYSVKNPDTISLFQTNVNYGVSDNLENMNNFKVGKNFSVGFDFGVVYEYRPKWMDYKYDLDGKTDLWRRDQDKYLVKVGIAATDIGSIRYTRSDLSRDFYANVQNLDINDIHADSFDGLNEYLDSAFIMDKGLSSKYRMNLPMALNIQADVRIAKGFYINFMPFIALTKGHSDVNKTHYLTTFNLIPRYDRKWFGASLPMQINSYKQFNVGLGLRLGPLWVGSNNILSTLISGRKMYGASACAMLKIPIMYNKPHDRDHDKVSDKKDVCPDIPGTLALKGCPDKDGDGITDAKDKCPDVPGLPAFGGCPDKDNDSIIDMNDDCPDQAGPTKYKGCPDSDNDGIIDREDDCPKVPGILKFKGCPDTDEDGIPDKDDNCPTVPGTIENHGCPFIDTDKDGIADKDDDCPTVPGEKIFNGCPDTDGDGISDKYDMCPTVKGTPENKGCPEIKKEEEEVLRKAFDNLEFETGKSIIRTSSFASLDELASVLLKRPEFKLLIAGHTDNVGNDAANMTLSKNRTLAVKDYLIKKGIDESRFKTDWFGETKPIAPNTTPEGRQKNRRVEMNIYF
jgi:outer membrane protein OmpA-like peptidoglycan-associated protein